MNTEQELGFSLDYTCVHGRTHTVTAPSTDLLANTPCECPERTLGTLKAMRVQIAILDDKLEKLERAIVGLEKGLDLTLEMLRKDGGK